MKYRANGRINTILLFMVIFGGCVCEPRSSVRMPDGVNCEQDYDCYAPDYCCQGQCAAQDSPCPPPGDHDPTADVDAGGPIGTDPADAGVTPTDGGAPTGDAGENPTEGGGSAADAGSDTDAGPENDAGSPPACQNDEDCGQHEVCVNGACVPDDHPCHADTDCAAGQECEDNQCVPPDEPDGGGCSSDEDCPAGQACDDGLCEPD